MDESQQSVWNLDGAQLNLIFQIKYEASVYLTSWQLDQAYWRLRDLRREIDAKLNRTKREKQSIKNPENKIEEREMTQKEMVDYLLEELTRERDAYLENEDKSRFYLVLEEFYLLLSELMKEHGLWLREGDDPSQAFRRR